MNDISNGIEVLERKISADANDAASRYRLAVLLLDEYGRSDEPELLSRAREHLARAVELRPAHARSHAALGCAYDLAEGGSEQALACFREARRLNPRDRQCEIYFLTWVHSRAELFPVLLGGRSPAHTERPRTRPGAQGSGG